MDNFIIFSFESQYVSYLTLVQLNIPLSLSTPSFLHSQAHATTTTTTLKNRSEIEASFNEFAAPIRDVYLRMGIRQMINIMAYLPSTVKNE